MPLLLGILGGVWLSRENYLTDLRLEEEVLAREVQALARTNRVLREAVAETKSSRSREDTEEGLAARMSQLRELPLRTPIVHRSMPRAELRADILAQMHSQYSVEELRDHENALSRLGLLPRETRFAQVVPELLSEQVAAFYDIERHELCTLEGLDLRNNAERMILAHELVRVLQDQNFGLDRLGLRRKDNDDAALAAAALVEGDATYHMGVYLHDNFRVNEIFHDLRLFFIQPADKLLPVPVYLREALMFPDRDGRDFVAALHARGGVEAVNRAYEFPPQSTEQILHPEKYLGPLVDAPKPVVLDFRPDPSWRLTQENVVGELGVRSLFSKALGPERAAEVAAGWGGDRYLVYDLPQPSDGWVLVWKSVWDTEADAREFFEALSRSFQLRYDALPAPGQAPKKGAPPLRVNAVFFSIAHQKQCVVLSRDTVWLVDVPEVKTMNRLLKELVGE